MNKQLRAPTLAPTKQAGRGLKHWLDRLEAHYEHLRATDASFDGFGNGGLLKNTGAETWREYWIDGHTPESALGDYRSYWGPDDISEEPLRLMTWAAVTAGLVVVLALWWWLT